MEAHQFDPEGSSEPDAAALGTQARAAANAAPGWVCQTCVAVPLGDREEDRRADPASPDLARSELC